MEYLTFEEYKENGGTVSESAFSLLSIKAKSKIEISIMVIPFKFLNYKPIYTAKSRKTTETVPRAPLPEEAAVEEAENFNIL